MLFKHEALLRFNETKPTLLEAIESCDMLRVLENGASIKTVKTESPLFAVDVPADIDRVEKSLLGEHDREAV